MGSEIVSVIWFRTLVFKASELKLWELGGE